MASIRLVKPVDIAACAQREVLDVEFKVIGTLTCRSTYLNPFFKFRNGLDDMYDLQIISIFSSTNGASYSEIENIPVANINNKTFKVRVRIPEHDDDGVVLTNMEYLKTYFYLDGNDRSEIGNVLGLQSGEFFISTTKSRYVKTKPIRTNRMINNIYVKIISEEILCPNDKINYKVEVTNNPFDDNPVWEDISELYKNRLTASIINTNIKSTPGISVRVTISKKDNSIVKINNICMTYY